MLERRRLEGAFRHPGHGFELTPCVVEVRRDPLTGHSARMLEGSRLMPAADFDWRRSPRRRGRRARSAPSGSRR